MLNYNRNTGVQFSFGFSQFQRNWNEMNYMLAALCISSLWWEREPKHLLGDLCDRMGATITNPKYILRLKILEPKFTAELMQSTQLQMRLSLSKGEWAFLLCSNHVRPPAHPGERKSCLGWCVLLRIYKCDCGLFDRYFCLHISPGIFKLSVSRLQLD